MLSRRLLIAGSGGAFTAPEPPSGATEMFEFSSAPDGAWTWFGEPRSIQHNGYAYVGYVDTSGNVCLRVYNESTETVGSEVTIRSSLDVDDHVNPSLIVRPDGKLQAFYAQHEPLSTTMHTRVTTNTLASDPTISGGWAAEVSLDAQLGAASYDYPVPIWLSGESVIHLFWRSIPSGSNYGLWHSTSSDGDTWASGELLYTDDYAYWKITSNGTNRIDFAVTNHSPNVGTTSLSHFYYDGTYRESDGTSIGSPDFTFADFTPVYAASNCWVWGIALDGSTPIIVFPTFPTEFSDHRYQYARWDGSAWDITEICAAGAGIDSTGVYSGGVELDKADPNIVYASRQVSGQWEMYRYTTADSGATFSEEALTSASSSKNIRPVSVFNADQLRVVWMYGSYTSYTSFSTGIRGLRLT